MKQVGRILNYKYGDHYDVVDHDANKLWFWVASNLDKSMNRMYNNWGKKITMDNDDSIDVLKVNYRPFENTILEMAESLI